MRLRKLAMCLVFALMRRTPIRIRRVKRRINTMRAAL